ncbi:MAG: HAMP domain-containing histidine kinase [Lachnospiraceae bacterium]|nr:HAMP domain-containing histidine kinase [Lachnospiraceae bacterium]
MNKLSKQIVIYPNIFLFLVILIVIGYYEFFAEEKLLAEKMKSISLIYDTIIQKDLSELETEEEEFLVTSTSDNCTIIICDEQYKLVYSQKTGDVQKAILNKIIKKKELYKKSPIAEYNPEKRGQPIAIRGCVDQDGEIYYVYLSESTWMLRQSATYARRQVLHVLVIVLICNILLLLGVAKWLTKPLKHIQEVTGKLANRDYSIRVQTKHLNNEIADLSNNINAIAENIQYNLTDLQNYNYLLLNQNQNLEEFEQMRKKFIGNMTHQLKTPLAIISSQSELFFYEQDKKKREYYMNSIMEEIDKMSLLISNILQNSKLEHEIMNVRLRWANLSEIIEELVPKYENLLATNRIELTTLIEEHCTAYIDPLQIEQAINNYMMNAYRHTKQGKKVKLCLYSDEESYFVSVFNEGICIPDSELEGIWTDFYHKKVTEAKAVGMEIGLGLYIVKDIMRQHNGECGVKNHKSGVEFYLQLPKER